ncbi:MAG: ATP-binding protein [Bacteroidales bacterium]|nr:ATP-binding protein [Bacteroidales bacterium]
MQRKRLPIGKQTFNVVRDPKENYVYIDKTQFAHKMIEAGGDYYFLARPRRFGKSLFLDTLSEIFKGNKELFKGLYIYDKWDWNQQFPVIIIDFTGGNYSSKENLQEMLRVKLKSNMKHLGLDEKECFHEEPGIFLQNIIQQTYLMYKQKVVVLIDEYDKPIIDNIGKSDKNMALVARETLRGLYPAIKASDRYLRFVFMTGVSKFSKLNLFSGLNNIQDITLDKNYATITGYTQIDLEENFAEYLQGVDLDTVKTWYNGYNYFGDAVYNPFDILLFLSNNCEFSNYWWETGNPSFLIEKLKEGNYFLPELENIEVGRDTLNAFDVEHIDLVALLWQTGYLTFDKKTTDGGGVFYKMKVPNLEIQSSLNVLFFEYLTKLNGERVRFHLNLRKALKETDFEGIKKELVSLFAAIPYENYVNNTIANFEGYYASVLFAFLSSIGYEIKTEESTNRGRIDMTLIGTESIYIIEFKVDMPAEVALYQIQTKKYYEKYLVQNKEIYLIGMHFSSKVKNIVGMEWRKLEIH